VNRYRITYVKGEKEDEEVEAERYSTATPWIDFFVRDDAVLRVREDNVSRIEVIESFD
jgi:hypothetical protein